MNRKSNLWGPFRLLVILSGCNMPQVVLNGSGEIKVTLFDVSVSVCSKLSYTKRDAFHSVVIR